MRILGLGTYDVRAHPRAGVLLAGLRAHGHVVRERVHPLGLSTADRVAMLRQPWRLPALAARLAHRWARLAADSADFRGGALPDAIVVGYLGHFDVLLARALYPRRVGALSPTIVLDHLVFAAGTASDRGAAEGLRTRALRRLDLLALRAADIIVLDTQEHADAVAKLAPEVEPRCVVAPVGASPEWFVAGARGSANRGASPPGHALRVVFYGLFTPLQGAPVIAHALRELGDRGVLAEVMLIGGGQDEAEVREILGASPGAGETALDGVRVRLVPWVDAAELPGVVAAHDVCLGIVGTTDKARNVVPNKVYQGAAAGCAVVTSDTAPQRRALGDAAIRVPPGDPIALAEALELLAHDRELTSRVRARCAALAGRSFTPAAVTAPLDRALRALRANADTSGSAHAGSGNEFTGHLPGPPP